MRTEHLPFKTLFVGVLGIAVATLGCSEGDAGGTDGDGGTEASGGGPAAGTGGSEATTTGAASSTGGQSTTGAAPGAGGNPPTTGGTQGTGATGAATGGTGPATGGTGPATGGTGPATGGTGPATGGMGPGTGGATTGGGPTGGAVTGGSDAGGSPTGGTDMGGAATGGGEPGGAATGGGEPGGAATGGGPGTGGEFTGTCTASEPTGRNVSGSGPHDVVMETNSEDGIRCGTIYRPADLGGDEKYPILVWGEGGCSQDGLSNQAAMGEIASWGYFIVADGTPGSTNACAGGQDGAAFLDYITWVIAENDKPCSAYYQSLETTKIAADGFSCGGLMAENVSGDPRFAAIGITSSGQFSVNAPLYDAIHTPFKVMNGGPDDMAYENGLRDYEEISSRGILSVYFSQTSAGHGGDLFQARGNFNLVNLAWLNWQLKGDEGATGKGFLYGSTCEFCTDPGWVYQSANIE
jgi:hypothetical protein